MAGKCFPVSAGIPSTHLPHLWFLSRKTLLGRTCSVSPTLLPTRCSWSRRSIILGANWGIWEQSAQHRTLRTWRDWAGPFPIEDFFKSLFSLEGRSSPYKEPHSNWMEMPSRLKTRLWNAVSKPERSEPGYSYWNRRHDDRVTKRCDP